jgi:hypothetical protein
MFRNGFRFLGLAALIAFFAYHLDPDDVPGLSHLTGGARIETISHGEEVDVTKYLSKTGRTIVEFTADW